MDASRVLSFFILKVRRGLVVAAAYRTVISMSAVLQSIQFFNIQTVRQCLRCFDGPQEKKELDQPSFYPPTRTSKLWITSTAWQTEVNESKLFHGQYLSKGILQIHVSQK